MRATIAVIGGDGIGPEVTAESVKVLEAVAERYSHTFTWRTGTMGGCAIDRFGIPLPDDTREIVASSEAVLFGAVGGPKWDNPKALVRPEDGILELRKRLGLFANLRPITVYPELISSSPLRPHLIDGVDMIIVRELTGGLYFGKPKKRWANSRGRKAVDTLSYSEREIERVVRVSFELARSRRKRLHSIDKRNVLETSRLWYEIACTVSTDYPDVELRHLLVDNAAMQLVRAPQEFDVVVAENMFGDILSDEAAVISGSMGMLPSASLSSVPPSSGGRIRRRRSKPALYEPIHGSAPDIAGRNRANPIATILSVALLLRYSFGLDTEATAIEHAVNQSLVDNCRTTDLVTNPDAALTTSEMGNAIINNLKS